MMFDLTEKALLSRYVKKHSRSYFSDGFSFVINGFIYNFTGTNHVLKLLEEQWIEQNTDNSTL